MKLKIIEDMLNTIKIPFVENGEFFDRLRVDLMQTFLNPQRVYRLRYRWAVSIATFLFIILIIAFASPGIVTKVNNFAFGDKNAQQELLPLDQPGLPKYYYAKATPSISDDPQLDLVQPDKTYMINQYDSPRRGRVMIVSEYDRGQQSNKIRRVSAGCY
jgi:hypothetical protein